MKRKLIKSAAFTLILAIAIFTTYKVTYSQTVNTMYETANIRANNAYNYGMQCGYTNGYSYAVETARLTDENASGYIITYGEDDGNAYNK